MKLPTPTQFAELLHKSLLPKEAKEIILEKLPTLSNEKVIQIYEKLREEQDKIHKAKSEFESKIKFTELKFDHDLGKLKENAE